MVCNDEDNGGNFFILLLSKVVIRCRKKKPGIKVDTGSYCSVTDCYSVIFSVSVISIVFSMAASFPNENGRFSSGKMK